MKIDNLPDKPGVYLFLDNTAKVLYVGKAKSIKNRVRSHFGRYRLESRQLAMISQINTVDYILTKNEKEALVLEDQLIKNIKPRYNVMLKDDKTYPFLEITMGEEFPALVITRTKTKNPKSLYFGPFPNVSEIRVAKRIIDRIFLLRRCKDYKERKRPCLNYQMGKCQAPCTGNIDRDEYIEMVEEVIMFLSGKNDKLLERLRKRMDIHKDKQEYEQAAIVRDQIEKLEQLFPIVNFRKISIQKLDALKKIDPSYLLKEILKMKIRPTVIEGFDISHTSANEAVGSMVYFKNGEPVKSNYRKFKIKQEETANDLKMMQEVVYRRLRRLLDENKKLPDILLIDGGRGQEAAARSVVRDLKIQDLRVLSLAKEKGNIYYKGRILKFENDSEVYKLFKRITDEAHRFAHSYHVSRRKKQFIK